jgi:hypothetical protein
MRKFSLVAAVAMTPLMGLPAWASACVTASVATYEATGFSCSVGGVTFSDIVVSTTSTGSGSVGLGNFTPFTIGAENGLSLNYTANTGTTPNSSADVAWTYNVAGNLLDDAFAAVAGNITGDGTVQMSEILSNGTTLTLGGAGSTTATFAPISSLGVIKDQNDFSGSAGSASSSILQNAFSVTATPLPAALPLFATGLFGLWGLRRNRKSAAAA